MYFHLTSPIGTICGSTEAGISTEILDLVNCPDCCTQIRSAAVKLHKRRKKDLDRLIIQRVLLDKHTLKNIGEEDLKAYQVRAHELEEEIKEFNPVTDAESYVMCIVAEEMEKGLEKEYDRQ
jgi:hypothetical protein